MTQWIQQLIWHSLAMTGLTLAYYAATVWLRKRYASKWFYLAGVILLIGFLIPFRPAITVEMDTAPAFLQGIATQPASVQPQATDLLPLANATTQPSVWHIAFMIWAAGALGTMVYHLLRHARFVRAVTRWSTAVKDADLTTQFDNAKRSLLLDGREIGLVNCAWISSPMLLWLGKPVILLPENMQVSENTRFILLHELVHYKRKDLLCRLVMLLSTAIHWFNPVIYLLVKLVTLQCEISCDEKVVEGQTIENRHQYAMSIINVAKFHAKGYTLLTTYFNGGKDTMKKRISSIYEPAKGRLGVFLLAIVMIMTMLAGTSIAANTGSDALTYTLPDTTLKINEKVDSYTVNWEPVEGIKEYHLGVYFQFQVEKMDVTDPRTGEVTKDITEFWAVGGGWIGTNTVKDNDGVEYTVENGAWEALNLPGDATSADISELVNSQTKTFEDGDVVPEKLLGCHLVIVAVRESGAPIHMDIELPVA